MIILQSSSHYSLMTKKKKKISEFVLNLDFSENYNIVVQDEAQSIHWASDITPICDLLQRE